MRGAARFRIADSRCYTALRGAVALFTLGCGLVLLHDNHAGGGCALIASVWLWHLLGLLNPRGFTLEARLAGVDAVSARSRNAAAARPPELACALHDTLTDAIKAPPGEIKAPPGEPLRWSIERREGGQSAAVLVRSRGLFRSVLWLELAFAPGPTPLSPRAYRGFPGVRAGPLPLLIFADAMEDSQWRGLRRTLRVYAGGYAGDYAGDAASRAPYCDAVAAGSSTVSRAWGSRSG